MYKHGKTLFVSIAYPPNPTASAVVHRHLLDQFDPASFEVITAYFAGAKRATVPPGIKKHFIYLSLEFVSSKLHRMLARIQSKTIPIFLNYQISRVKPARVIIGYPDLYWLNLCSNVVIKRNIPFVAYLHDTILEATYFGRSKELAREVQERIFSKALGVAVMSEGMRALLKQKYQVDSIAWEHIYPEKPVFHTGAKENRAHWSGDVYEVNHKSVARLNEAIARTRMIFSLSNGKTREQLNAFGITGGHIQKVFYPSRHTYLQQLGTARILLLGLNYADECAIHEDELATIFSTKTPEYLGSGSLIVYHGPSHYFLARFLTEHNCGVVIDSRDAEGVYQQLRHILENYDEYESKIMNAVKCLSLFDPARIAKKLVDTLDV